MAFCRQCGHRNPEASIFCEECGATLAAAPPAAMPVPAETDAIAGTGAAANAKKWLVGAGICALALAGLALGLFLTTSSSTGNPILGKWTASIMGIAAVNYEFTPDSMRNGMAIVKVRYEVKDGQVVVFPEGESVGLIFKVIDNNNIELRTGIVDVRLKRDVTAQRTETSGSMFDKLPDSFGASGGHPIIGKWSMTARGMPKGVMEFGSDTMRLDNAIHKVRYKVEKGRVVVLGEEWTEEMIFKIVDKDTLEWNMNGVMEVRLVRIK